MAISFFRADGRTLEALKVSGFAPRAPFGSRKDLIDKLADPLATAKEIQYAGQASYWVSTSLDAECRGQTKGNSVYTFSLEVGIYKKDGKLMRAVELEKAIGGVNPKLGCFIPVTKPHLVMDTADLTTATVIGLLHAQEGTADGKGTAEVSFLTAVKGDLISKL